MDFNYMDQLIIRFKKDADIIMNGFKIASKKVQIKMEPNIKKFNELLNEVINLYEKIKEK